MRGSERPVRGERTTCIGIVECSRVAEVWTFHVMLSNRIVSVETGQQAFGPSRSGGLVLGSGGVQATSVCEWTISTPLQYPVVFKRDRYFHTSISGRIWLVICASYFRPK